MRKVVRGLPGVNTLAPRVRKRWAQWSTPVSYKTLRAETDLFGRPPCERMRSKDRSPDVTKRPNRRGIGKAAKGMIAARRSSFAAGGPSRKGPVLAFERDSRGGDGPKESG